MPDESNSRDEKEPPRAQENSLCLRCRMLKPVDDDGFCESCAKAIEQACL